MMSLMGSEKAIFKNRVTKSLHKSVMSKGELGQWTSDQVGHESRVTHDQAGIGR